MQITNKTPWCTAGLEAFVLPFAKDTKIVDIQFYNQVPRPGVKREHQKICEFGENSTYDYSRNTVTAYPTLLRIGLLSPKRAKARLDPLERLARAKTLQIHEIDLPHTVLAQIAHTFTWLKKPAKQYYHWRGHVIGNCNCKMGVIAPPVIPGDTRVKTGTPVTKARLHQKLRWAQQSVDRLTEKLEEKTKARDRLLVRINKKLAQERV